MTHHLTVATISNEMHKSMGVAKLFSLSSNDYSCPPNPQALDKWQKVSEIRPNTRVKKKDPQRPTSPSAINELHYLQLQFPPRRACAPKRRCRLAAGRRGGVCRYSKKGFVAAASPRKSVSAMTGSKSYWERASERSCSFKIADFYGLHWGHAPQPNRSNLAAALMWKLPRE